MGLIKEMYEIEPKLNSIQVFFEILQLMETEDPHEVMELIDEDELQEMIQGVNDILLNLQEFKMPNFGGIVKNIMTSGSGNVEKLSTKLGDVGVAGVRG